MRTAEIPCHVASRSPSDGQHWPAASPTSPPSVLSQQTVTATGKHVGTRDGGKEMVPGWGGRTPDAAGTAPAG